METRLSGQKIFFLKGWQWAALVLLALLGGASKLIIASGMTDPRMLAQLGGMIIGYIMIAVLLPYLAARLAGYLARGSRRIFLVTLWSVALLILAGQFAGLVRGETGVVPDHAIRHSADNTTFALLEPDFQADGRKAHSLVLRKDLPDDRILLALLICGQDKDAGTFVVGVDFGVGERWKDAQPVRVKFGSTDQTNLMQPFAEYLGFEGPTAKEIFANLTRASGELEFSGPDGASATFSLDTVSAELAQIRRLCKL